MTFDWHGLWEGKNEFSTSAASTAWANLCESSKDGIELLVHFREAKGKRTTGMLEFLSRGFLPMSWNVFFAMLMDGDYRKQWDPTAVECIELSSHESGLKGGLGLATLVFRSFRLPWPAGIQEYLQNICAHEEVDGSGRHFRCISLQCLPELDSVAIRPPVAKRIFDMEMRFTFAQSGDGLEFASYYFEDPRVWVPQWALKAGTSRALPISLAQQVKAGCEYPEACLSAMLSRYGIQAESAGYDEAVLPIGQSVNTNIDESENASCEQLGRLGHATVDYQHGTQGNTIMQKAVAKHHDRVGHSSLDGAAIHGQHTVLQCSTRSPQNKCAPQRSREHRQQSPPLAISRRGIPRAISRPQSPASAAYRRINSPRVQSAAADCAFASLLPATSSNTRASSYRAASPLAPRSRPASPRLTLECDLWQRPVEQHVEKKLTNCPPRVSTERVVKCSRVSVVYWTPEFNSECDRTGNNPNEEELLERQCFEAFADDSFEKAAMELLKIIELTLSKESVAENPAALHP